MNFDKRFAIAMISLMVAVPTYILIGYSLEPFTLKAMIAAGIETIILICIQAWAIWPRSDEK